MVHQAVAPADRPVDPNESVPLAATLRLAIMRLARRLRQLADAGITPSMLSALSSVERLGPLTLGELADVEKVQPPTMTPIVGRLEADGLVNREIDPGDRRVARITASRRGRQLLERTRSRKTAYLARRLRALPPEDREVIGRAVKILEGLVSEEA
jgi:DNA-binding MarR family transcriptional regulator